MHYYVLSALATYPLPLLSKSRLTRSILCNRIFKQRLLLANAGSVRTFINQEEINKNKLHLVYERNIYRLFGKALFMSLSGIADIGLLTVEDPQKEKVVIAVDLKDESISYGPISKNQTLKESRTRQVTFNGTPIPVQYIFSGKGDADAGIFQRTWFQGLLPAIYLGASAKLFNLLLYRSKSKFSVSRNCTISNLDEFKSNSAHFLSVFKMGMRLSSQIGDDINQVIKKQKSISEVCEASALAKLFVSEQLEKPLKSLLSFFGVEGLVDQDIQKIIQQLQFASVQPMSSFDLYQHLSYEIYNSVNLS
jgi:hypothetical protein